MIAALDIGWLGAATDATIVDLAGLTDPAIAVLPGGHTSKAIPASLLEARGVDALVLQVREGEARREPWTTSYFGRNVELRIARIPGMDEAFRVKAESTVPHLHYVVLSKARRSETPLRVRPGASAVKELADLGGRSREMTQ